MPFAYGIFYAERFDRARLSPSIPSLFATIWRVKSRMARMEHTFNLFMCWSLRTFGSTRWFIVINLSYEFTKSIIWFSLRHKFFYVYVRVQSKFEIWNFVLFWFLYGFARVPRSTFWYISVYFFENPCKDRVQFYKLLFQFKRNTRRNLKLASSVEVLLYFKM